MRNVQSKEESFLPYLKCDVIGNSDKGGKYKLCENFHLLRNWLSLSELIFSRS
jgi:hypothetical protein